MDDFTNRVLKAAQDEVAKQSKFLTTFQELQLLFSDLRISEGRWGKRVICSKSVIPTDFETRFNCGCCEDSPLEVWLYTSVMFGGTEHRVYTDPAKTFVGDRANYGSSVRLYSYFAERLRALGASEEIIEKIRLLGVKEEEE